MGKYGGGHKKQRGGRHYGGGKAGPRGRYRHRNRQNRGRNRRGGKNGPEQKRTIPNNDHNIIYLGWGGTGRFNTERFDENLAN